MSITTVTPENVDQFGRFTVVTREIGPIGATGVHRRRIEPGRWKDGSWVATDTSEEHPVVQAFVAELWSADVVDAFKAAFPWVPPEE